MKEIFDEVSRDSDGYSITSISDLSPGDHLCCIYEKESEHRSVLTSYVRQGLEADQKVIYIADGGTAEEVLDYLRDVDFLPEPYLSKDQLELLTAEETYLRSETFDPDFMIELLEEETEKAKEEGYSALRVTGEMTWALRDLPGSDRLIEYETKLNDFFPHNKALGLCQYDETRFDPEILLEVLRTHPIAVVGDEVYDNFHYISPEEKLSGKSAQAEFDAWKEGLKKSKERKHELRHLNSLLKSIRNVNRIIAKADDVDGLMEEAGASLLDTRDYQGVSIALLDEGSDRIVPRFQFGDHSFTEAFSISPSGEGEAPPCVEEVVRTGEIKEVTQVNDCAGCSFGEAVQGTTALAVPFMREEVIGVLHVWLAQDEIPAEEKELLKEVAGDLSFSWEKLKTEEELRRSHERFRNIVQGSPYPMMVHAEDGEVLSVNKVWTDITGYQESEIPMIEDWTRKAFGEDRWNARSDIAELYDLDDRHDEGEYEVTTRSGETRIWDFSSAPLGRLPDGRRLVLSVAHDITERKELEQRNEMVSSTLDQAAMGIYWITPGGEIEYANKIVEGKLGYSREGLVGKRVSDINPKFDRSDRKEHWNRIKEEGELKHETVHKRKDGTEFPVEVTSYYVKHEGREYEFAFVKDITERKRSQKRLRRYKKIVEQLNEPVMLQDREGNYLLVNEAVAEYSGLTREELIGKDESAFMDESTSERIREIKDRVLESEEAREYTISPDLSTKGKRHFKTTRFPFYDESGELIGTGAICLDITEKQEAKEELEESESMLRQSFIELAETTSRVLGVRDPYTQAHERRVAELAREVGERMDLDDDALLGLYLGGVLHDIGKIAIPETILTKPGELKDVEWKLIKSHPKVGYDQILEDTNFPWPVAEMTLHHHERLDGSGYPDGLEGDELSLEVRILGAVDVVEAMSTRRPYREARTKEKTLSVIKEGKGEKFDPEVVDVLVEMIEEGVIDFEE